MTPSTESLPAMNANVRSALGLCGGRTPSDIVFGMKLLPILLCASAWAQNPDVVVYGGTAGGAITAISAARQGLKVTLLEPGKHIGGMVTGGLSRTDVGR